MSTQSYEPIFNELMSDDVLYVFEVQNKSVGMFKFINLKHRNAHIPYLGGVAIDPTQSGKGYGALMMQGLLAWEN